MVHSVHVFSQCNLIRFQTLYYPSVATTSSLWIPGNQLTGYEQEVTWVFFVFCGRNMCACWWMRMHEILLFSDAKMIFMKMQYMSCIDAQEHAWFGFRIIITFWVVVHEEKALRISTSPWVASKGLIRFPKSLTIFESIITIMTNCKAVLPSRGSNLGLVYVPTQQVLSLAG